MLKDFYQKTTKKFDVNINYNGTEPNITLDTLTFLLKTKKDGETILTKVADVATSGATGIAKFNLSKLDTDIAHGRYYYEIYWSLSTGEEYVLDSGELNVLNRI